MQSLIYQTKVVFNNDYNLIKEYIKNHNFNNILLITDKNVENSVKSFAELRNLLKDFSLKEYKVKSKHANLEEIIDFTKSVVEGEGREIDCIVAMGGGSVIDTAKAISMYLNNQENFWETVKLSSWSFSNANDIELNSIIPLITVPTTASSGSEANNGFTLLNKFLGEKCGFGHNSLYPKLCIVDHNNLKTLDDKVLAQGAADILAHLVEQLFSKEKDAVFADGVTVGMIWTLVSIIEKSNKDEEIYRKNMSQLSIYSLSGICSEGKARGDWTSHAISHAISAINNASHGETLAVLLPSWLDYIKSEENADRFYLLASAFSVDISEDKMKTCDLVIEKVRSFFNNLGLPSSLKDLGLSSKDIEVVARKTFIQPDVGYIKEETTEEDIIKILNKSL